MPEQITKQYKQYLIASRQTRELLSAFTLSELLSEFTPSELRSVLTPSELRSVLAPSELLSALAPSELLSAFKLSDSDIPKLEKPYTRMLHGIESEGYLHKQSTFGDWRPGRPICGTPMCTAGHLVAQAGEAGWALKEKLNGDWGLTATFLHYAAHPDRPAQNYGNIKQELALAYVRQMAEFEAAE